MTDAAARDAAAFSASDNAGTAAAIPLTASDEEGVLNKAELEQEVAAAAPSAVQSDEIVESGRALALADFTAPAVGPGERLIRMAYRMGVPATLLTSPFSKSARTRVLATVANPLPGNKAAGTALRAGHAAGPTGG